MIDQAAAIDLENILIFYTRSKNKQQTFLFISGKTFLGDGIASYN